MKRRARPRACFCCCAAPARGRGPGLRRQPGHDPDHLQLYRHRHRGVRRHRRRPARSARGRDIVVVVRGPDADMTVRRRDRVAGVWINHDAARLSTACPSYYFLASTRPLSRHRAAGRAGALRHRPAESAARQPCTAIMITNPSARRRCATDAGPALYRNAGRRGISQRDPVPRPCAGAGRVTRGQYNVEVYLFRDGEVISAQSTPLFIDQTGLERRLFNFAHDQPLRLRPGGGADGDDDGLDVVGVVPPARPEPRAHRIDPLAAQHVGVEARRRTARRSRHRPHPARRYRRRRTAAPARSHRRQNSAAARCGPIWRRVAQGCRWPATSPGCGAGMRLVAEDQTALAPLRRVTSPPSQAGGWGS